MIVVVGEGARGALGHRGTTSPGRGLVDAMPERSPPTGGEATPPITGRWDHGWWGWSGSLAVSRQELLSAVALPTRSFVPPEYTVLTHH